MYIYNLLIINLDLRLKFFYIAICIFCAKHQIKFDKNIHFLTTFIHLYLDVTTCKRIQLICIWVEESIIKVTFQTSIIKVNFFTIVNQLTFFLYIFK